MEGRDFITVDLNSRKGLKTLYESSEIGGTRKQTASNKEFLKGYKGVQTIMMWGGKPNDMNLKLEPHIAIDSKRVSKIFERFKRRYSSYYDTIKTVTPNQNLFLKDLDSFYVYLLAREKAKIRHAFIESQYAASGVDRGYELNDLIRKSKVEINKRTNEELKRAYKEVERIKRTPSERNINDVNAAIAARGAPKDVAINTVQGYAARASDYLGDKSKVGIGVAAGAAVGAYALSDKEEGDPLRNALVAGLAVGLGPKAYRAITSKSLDAISMRIKAEVARGLEVDTAIAKVWELRAQRIIEQLDTLDDATIVNMIEAIETGTKIKGKTPDGLTDLKDIQKEITSLLDKIGDAAVKSGLIKDKGEIIKLGMRQMNPETRGAFLNNYFPHLFVHMDKLTDEDIAAIFGRLEHTSM